MRALAFIVFACWAGFTSCGDGSVPWWLAVLLILGLLESDKE